MGPAVAATFLQRALTALNRNGQDYPDLVPDGRIGAGTLAALDAFPRSCAAQRSGETVLLRALEALQGERYLRLAERRPANEAFLYGWLANRIGEQMTPRCVTANIRDHFSMETADETASAARHLRRGPAAGLRPARRRRRHVLRRAAPWRWSRC